MCVRGCVCVCVRGCVCVCECVCCVLGACLISCGVLSGVYVVSWCCVHGFLFIYICEFGVAHVVFVCLIVCVLVVFFVFVWWCVS